MSLRNHVVPATISAFLLVLLTACGSSYNAPHPPPGGSFSNSDLKGTYVFSVAGSDSSGGFIAIAGTFTADGNGNITGGTIDVNEPLVGAPATGLTVSGGGYSVATDGRGGYRSGGGLTLTVGTSSIGFDFVLTSSQGGMITEFDGGGSGSGTFALQSSVTQSAITGPWAFNLTGTAGFGTSLCGAVSPTGSVSIPFATAGAVTLAADGSVTAGIEDFNENCVSIGGTSGLTITSGSVSLATVPGTATFTASNSQAYTYDVYPVDATHLKLIESDTSSFAVAGDMFTQTTSIPTANIYTLAGFDPLTDGPFSAAGILDTDGSTVTGGTEDINDAGTAQEVTSFGGSYTPLTGGRSLLTLNGGFINGGGLQACLSCQFAVYPTTGGLQILEVDNAGMTGGIAYTQSATSIASSQGYGLNLTGSNASSEEDDIAEFTNNSGTLTGLIDYNDQGVLNGDQVLHGTYAADTTISGRGTITWGTYQLTTYVVDNATTVFVETDANQVGLGSFAEQTVPTVENPAMRHLMVLRMTPMLKKAARQR